MKISRKVYLIKIIRNLHFVESLLPRQARKIQERDDQMPPFILQSTLLSTHLTLYSQNMNVQTVIIHPGTLQSVYCYLYGLKSSSGFRFILC